MPLVLIPILIMAAMAYLRSRDILRDQASSQMVSAAQSQVAILQNWIQIRQQRLQLGSQRSEVRTNVASALPQSPPPTSALDPLRAQLQDLRSYQGQSMFSHLLVARISDGIIIASSNPDWEGQPLPALRSGDLPSAAASTRPLYDDPLLAPDALVILSAVPMRALDQQNPDSLLIGANLDLRIAALMEEMQVFWEERGVYRVERGITLLTLAPDVIIQLPRYATAPTAQVIPEHPVFSRSASTSGVIEYDSFDGEPVLGAYQWLPDLDLGVVVELPRSDVFAGLSSLVPYTLGLVVLAAALTWIVMLIATNRMLQPLGALTEFAQRISRGEWRSRVPEDRSDELGVLAAAFNRMAEDLSQLYRSLEQRVEERTRQIQTAAEVARAVISTPALGDLLRQAVSLIRERFGYDHVSIYFLDDSGRHTLLQEATGEIGRRLISKGYLVPVDGDSLIGWVCANNQALVASDQGSGEFPLQKEIYPDSRAEIAVPLQVGGHVLGVLDVHSTDAEAFDGDQREVLQTLADQLSAAIQNARLAQQSAEAAERALLASRLTAQLSGLLDVEEVLHTSADALHRSLGEPGLVIKLNTPEVGRGSESDEGSITGRVEGV
jgi:HAMP domain-containing protein